MASFIMPPLVMGPVMLPRPGADDNRAPTRRMRYPGAPGGAPMAEHVRRNRAAWNGQAASYAEPGRLAWASEPSWGIWSVPEAELGVLPEVAGLDTLELGCGTAYVSAWLARRGARPVGVDISEAQLATARALQERH